MSDNIEILDRLTHLRLLMKSKGIDVFLVNGSDPHSSEYVQDHWKTREYLSGFTGSYGWLAITLKDAALWTDSRYYIQADQELAATGIKIEKARTLETLSVGKWITARLKSGTVGFDGMCYSYSEIKQLKEDLGPNFELNSNCNLLDTVWHDRPSISFSSVFDQPVEFSGESRNSKLTRIRKLLKDNNSDMIVLTALDEIAWAFNLRGSDVEYNPVFFSYAIIEDCRAMLFAEISKIPISFREKLMNDGIEMFSYSQFYDILRIIIRKKVLIDPKICNYNIYEILNGKNTLIKSDSIVQQMKSIKNATEIEGFKKAMVQDGVALLDFFFWLDKMVKYQNITEFDITKKLFEYRSKQKYFLGESFSTIAGFGKNGAIVHYHVKEEKAQSIGENNLLLIDSGAQYQCGTTDITRTVFVGSVADAGMKRYFTLVLKGMIALSQIHFPKGTCGCHLDVLARKALWQNGLNYGHGTSHGVGAFLNVHEGPESVRSDFNSVLIEPGMVISNEPGIYIENKYGIRTENMILCVEDRITDFGTFYKFETLTLFPIDQNLIDTQLLDEQELAWLNDYHKTVYEKLSPFCDDPSKLDYLKQMCTQITK